MECLKSINRHIILDNRAYYLLFLQDMYPYFDKYLDTDYLSELVERIEYVMNLMNDSGKSDETSKSYNSDKSGTPDITQETNHISACDKALLLDYKAQLLFPRKEYDNAIKKYKKAIALIGKITIRPILRMPVPPICFQTCTTTSLQLICSGRNWKKPYQNSRQLSQYAGNMPVLD